MDCPNDRQTSGCPINQYYQPNKGCTPCDTICFPDSDLNECTFYCCEYWRDLQRKERQHKDHEDRGDSTIILAVVVSLGILLVLAACIYCGCKLWSWYQQIQDEKKKACQETGHAEEGTMPPGVADLRKGVDDALNNIPVQPRQNEPDAQPLITVTPRTASAKETTPQPTGCSSPESEPPTTHPEHANCTTATQTQNNEVDTDQTSVKVIDDGSTSERPSTASSNSRSSQNNLEERNSLDLVRPSDTNTTAQTPQYGTSLPSLHRVGLRRMQGSPQVLIHIPNPLNEDENEPAGAYFIPGQASPDPVVTDPYVTEATTDETSKSSITRNKNCVHLYRLDVNQRDHEEAIATQPVNNIPQEFGIQVRNNPEEYLQ